MSDNIQVVVRCRARNRQEISAKSPTIVELPNDEFSADEPFVTITNDPSTTVSGVARSIDSTSKVFKVDQVYGPNADQALLFNSVALPLFHDFISGLNVTILAYGQTGSGKTYSMCGDLAGENSGLMPRILSKLFSSIDADHMVKISCVELYKEELHDLINNEFDLTPFKTKLRLGPGTTSMKPSTVIHNLTEVHIDSGEMGFNILKKCLDRRKTCATKLNDISSRSHTIFSINLYRKKNQASSSDEYIKSTMNLVDLAGSEDINKSGATNERAREAGSINQSLLALGKVISALSEGKDLKHVPYRESKLTRILQGSIGGQTKTVLIATISPAKVNYSETISTLNYASKAKNIKNIPQSISESEIISKKVLVKELSSRIARLERDRISAAEKDNHVKISVQNYKDFCNASLEFETSLKEKDSQINKLSSKLETKIHAASLCQDKVISLEAELNALKQETAHKDSIIQNLKDEAVAKEAIDSERARALLASCTKFKSGLKSLISGTSALVNTNTTCLTEDLQRNRIDIVDHLGSASQKLNHEFDKMMHLFGPEWKQGLMQELKKHYNFSADLEELEALDFSSGITRLENTERRIHARIANSISINAHAASVKLTSEQMAHELSTLKENLLAKICQDVDSTLRTHQDAMDNLVRGNLTQIVSENTSSTTEALEELSKERMELTTEVENKTGENLRNIASLRKKLGESTDAAGARIYDMASHRIKTGVKDIASLNTKQSADSLELVNKCFTASDALVRTSRETFDKRLERAKGEEASVLDEIKDQNIPQMSPKRRASMSPSHSPFRHGVMGAKRQTLWSPTKAESFRSQIPQLHLSKN